MPQSVAAAAVVLSLSARVAAGGLASTACKFDNVAGRRAAAGGSLCCRAKGEWAPVRGAQYQFLNVSFYVPTDTSSASCSTNACWHVDVKCDGGLVERTPATGSTCQPRGTPYKTTHGTPVLICKDSFSVCIGNDDPSVWPAEYCTQFQNALVYYSAAGTAGPPSFAEKWGPPIAILVILFGLCGIFAFIVNQLYPKLGWRAYIPVYVFMALLAAATIAAPNAFGRFLIDEWKVGIRVIAVMIVGVGVFIVYLLWRKSQNEVPGYDRELGIAAAEERRGLIHGNQGPPPYNPYRDANAPPPG